MKISDFFKKQSNKKMDLEQVRNLGIITEQEFLELKIKRAEMELFEFLEKKKKNFKKGVSK